MKRKRKRRVRRNPLDTPPFGCSRCNGMRARWDRGYHACQASTIPTHGTNANPRGSLCRLDTKLSELGCVSFPHCA